MVNETHRRVQAPRDAATLRDANATFREQPGEVRRADEPHRKG